MDLSRLFAAAEAALILKQEELNAADALNGNHGDHMVEIFQAATEAAATQAASSAGGGVTGAGLAEAMDYAAGLLYQQAHNGSAQVYARGLEELAAQLRQRKLTLKDLVSAVQTRINRETTGVENPEPEAGKTTETLKALLNALAGWEKAEAAAASGNQFATTKNPMDMGYLFGVGMAYLQARQKGGDPLDILVDTVVSASPLANVPHRAQSGKIALRAMLEGMAKDDG
jgi:hypothetical protein